MLYDGLRLLQGELDTTHADLRLEFCQSQEHMSVIDYSTVGEVETVAGEIHVKVWTDDVGHDNLVIA